MEAILKIVKCIELNDQVRFVNYVVRITQGKANLKPLGVDLILSLMMLLKDPFGVDSNSQVKDSWGFDFLEALVQHCSDSNVGI